MIRKALDYLKASRAARLRELAFSHCRKEGLHVFRVQELDDRVYLIDTSGQRWRIHRDGK